MTHVALRTLAAAAAAAAVLMLSGCTMAVLAAYDIATDARAIAVQHTDAAIANTIRGELMEAGLQRFLAVDVFCHQGMVVLTGVTTPGNDAGTRAVAIARRQAGVRRVETSFFAERHSRLDDLGLGVRFYTRIFLDSSLLLAHVDFAAINGQLVLAGVVKDQAEMEAILRHARDVAGLKGVKSYLQLKALQAKVP
jgi:osmotically-inducible protein OsmY